MQKGKGDLSALNFRPLIAVVNSSSVARTRTTKKLAQRIDLNYFKRKTPLKRAKFWFSVLLPVLALLWIFWSTFNRDSRVYSSGRMSAPHAVLEAQCAACHLRKAGQFSAQAEDSACLACHDAPVHHASVKATPICSDCHTEHRGRVNIRAARNQDCARCHADLSSAGGAARFSSHIRSFSDGHPQFAVLRDAARDPGTIQLNHSLHMKLIRRGPDGPDVRLVCGDCHRAAVAAAAWPYADAKYVTAKVSYTDSPQPPVADVLTPSKPLAGREYLAPPKFATACASCHLLTFDWRFEEGVPHDKPGVVHAFLVKKFTDYIAAHPAELRETRDSSRILTGRPAPPQSQLLTPAQWVAQHAAVSEELLWHKTCSQCHTLTGSALQDTVIARWDPAAVASFKRTAALQPGSVPLNVPIPSVAPSRIKQRWMPHAKFDHDAHRGFSCEGCHERALTSVNTIDVLLPGIATCQKCHAPGPDHAESRCFECHTYHDWARRKEVTPRFALPALRTGGR